MEKDYISREQIISEEQECLNRTIRLLDEDMACYDEQVGENVQYILTPSLNPEAAAFKAIARRKITDIDENKRQNREVRKSLYGRRVEVSLTPQMSDGTQKRYKKEFKIGLHSYTAESGEKIIYSWRENGIGQTYYSDPPKEYLFERKSYGETIVTVYSLDLYRSIISRDEDIITEADQLFPHIDVHIMYDPFLKELISRRTEQEFKNIVFSIQKRQRAIIEKPFSENLIVQGCAGSGKSMIMLHRLPILIFNNPDIIDFSRIYSITPSDMYIRQMQSMMVDLELEPLRTGTINQYFDSLINKYGKSEKDYGSINYSLKIDKDIISRVFTRKTVNMIKSLFRMYAKKHLDTINTVLTGIGNEEITLSGTPFDRIKGQIDAVERLLADNKKILNKYNSSKLDERLIRKLINGLTGFYNKLIAAQKSFPESSVESNYIQMIESMLKNLMNELGVSVDDHITKLSDDGLYEYLERRSGFLNAYASYRGILDNCNTSFADTEKRQLSKLKEDLIAYCDEFAKLEPPILNYSQFKQFETIQKEYREFIKRLPLENYYYMMKSFGFDYKEKAVATVFSPYLYLQILFCFYGAIDKRLADKLVTIDEAQELSFREIKLIKDVNGDDVILNLYGDTNQHIEGTKGIDNWSLLENICSFSLDVINENYRNAQQITEYCNTHFDMQMNPINPEGKGVEIIEDKSVLYEEIEQIDGSGLFAIIVKDNDTRKKLKKVLSGRVRNISDVSETHSINNSKWNILTVIETKGLEFKEVIVFDNNMSKNEKYITYTRALDKLVIYTKSL